MKSAKNIYSQFCEKSKQPLIFQTPLWLDAVAGPDNWDVVLAYQGDFLSGAFPYVTKKKFGLNQITLPFLTPYLGPIFKFPQDLLESNKLSFKKKTLESLINQLPNTDRFITQTDFNFDYWLPFYWQGFKQTTRYSFILETHKTEEQLLSNCKPSIKKQIRKASSIYTLRKGSDISTLYDLHQKDLTSKKIQISFTK